ncbi:putative pectinesterase/pectinesterase inhibitor 51 [Tasmannia lanceolata]|uniref:putative pectinesterase/pectinesterase inhibitor 51 n=1 Tax=Tasmannia lanceolata TaxID=3420 RepID=UPI0040634489
MNFSDDNKNLKEKTTTHTINYKSNPTEPIPHQKPMSSLLFLTLISFIFLLFLSFTISHPTKTPPILPLQIPPIAPQIIQACKATQFPNSCQTTLSQSNLPNPPKPIDLILTSIQISSQNLQTAQSMSKTILETASNDQNRSNAAKNCLEFLSYSQYRLSLSSSPEILPRGKIKDARAWLSAALLYQYDCWSALKYVNTTQRVNSTMAFLNSLTELTSNSLSMLVSYDLFGNGTELWKPPETERNGFWEAAGGESGSGFRRGFPANLTVDCTVCKDEEGCYRTVQSAVDSAPENLADGKGVFVIYIKEGVYEETVRVPLEKRNVVFLGDGMGKTVITGKLNAGTVGVSTYNTATVAVNGDGFMARDLTFENTAGPDAHQAVAFRSTGDLSILENCEFLGHQDTLYAHSLRQFYKSCHIEGTVDFIFGNSATIFQDSLILVRPRQLPRKNGENNAVTAHGRTDPAQSTGFVFQNCVINGTVDYMALYYQKPQVHKNYLGRPWKQYSRTVYISCYLESLIRPEGWLPWSGNFALSTLYYGEFKNSGPGENTSARVNWSSQIPAEHVSVYSLESFIQGDEWIPSVGG